VALVAVGWPGGLPGLAGGGLLLVAATVLLSVVLAVVALRTRIRPGADR
jgi:hypothetical protein